MEKTPFENKSDSETPTATLQIYNFINTYLARESDTNVNRASSASQCYKSRWYKKNNYPAEPLTPRVRVNFLLGDLSEKTMQYFIQEGCVGNGKLYSEVDFGREVGRFEIQGKEIKVFSQPDLEGRIGEIKVTAHVDGWGKRNSDGCWELIECKSAADFGFEKFKQDGPGDYLKQATVNLQTDKAKELGAKQVRFFYLKKNTGHLWDRLFDFDHELASEVEGDYKISNQLEEPSRPYIPQIETFRTKPTGRKILPWQCGYCAYTKTCWPNADLEFKNGKPIYIVKELA